MREPSTAGSSPRMRSSPLVGFDTQPIIRMVDVLPAPFGPEEAERLARLHLEVDAVDRDEVAEALGEVRSLDQGPGGRE